MPQGIHPVYPLSLSRVAGPQLLAPWLSSVLCVVSVDLALTDRFGIFVVQSFSYYESLHHGRKDHWLDVGLVAGTALVSTVTMCLEGAELWRSFILG